DEDGAALAHLPDPARETLHHTLRLIKAQALLARKAAHLQGLGLPGLGDGPQARVKGLIEWGPHKHGTEANHAVIAGDGTVRFHADHEIGHRSLQGGPPGVGLGVGARVARLGVTPDPERRYPLRPSSAPWPSWAITGPSWGHRGISLARVRPVGTRTDRVEPRRRRVEPRDG